MDKTLMHVGVLGMRWGRRRGSRSNSTQNTPHHSAAPAPHKPTISEMSNEELIARTTRLKLESDYMNAIPKRTASKGERFMQVVAMEVLKPSAIDIGKSFLTGQAKKRLGMTPPKAPKVPPMPPLPKPPSI